MANTIQFLSANTFNYKGADHILVSVLDSGGAGVGGATVTATFVDPMKDWLYNTNSATYEAYDAGHAALGQYLVALDEVDVGPYADGQYKLFLGFHNNVLLNLDSISDYDRHILVRINVTSGLDNDSIMVGCIVQRQATLASLGTSDDLISKNTEITTADLTTVGGVLRLLATQAFCNQVIDDTEKKLKLYDSDGTDVVLTFNLQDAAGLASVREPFRKLRD